MGPAKAHANGHTPAMIYPTQATELLSEEHKHSLDTEYPSLIEMSNKFESVLGVSGTTVEVVEAACKEYGINDAELSLVQKAEKAWEVMQMLKPKTKDAKTDVEELEKLYPADAELAKPEAEEAKTELDEMLEKKSGKIGDESGKTFTVGQPSGEA